MISKKDIEDIAEKINKDGYITEYQNGYIHDISERGSQNDYAYEKLEKIMKDSYDISISSVADFVEDDGWSTIVFDTDVINYNETQSILRKEAKIFFNN